MVTSSLASSNYSYYFGTHVNIILPESHHVGLHPTDVHSLLNILQPSEFENSENKISFFFFFLKIGTWANICCQSSSFLLLLKAPQYIIVYSNCECLWLCYPTILFPGFYPREKKAYVHIVLYMNVPSGFICNSSKLEVTQKSFIIRWMDKQIVVYTYNVVILSNKWE